MTGFIETIKGFHIIESCIKVQLTGLSLIIYYDDHREEYDIRELVYYHFKEDQHGPISTDNQ